LLLRADANFDGKNGESLGIENALEDTGVGSDYGRGILLLFLDLHDI